MTEPATPAAPATGPGQSQPTQGQPDGGTETAPRGERIGTILMAVAIGVVAVLVIDVATKGKLLAPLFALLPAPKTPGEPDAETRPAGE